jgi:hypothetical protein
MGMAVQYVDERWCERGRPAVGGLGPTGGALGDHRNRRTAIDAEAQRAFYAGLFNWVSQV